MSQHALVSAYIGNMFISGDDMEDASSTKDRKIRRSNSANRQSAAGDASTSSLSVKRRPSPSAHKQRKISSNL